MNLPSRFPNLPFLRRRQPKIEEFETLLNLIPHASVLIDLQLDKIVFANAKATELTAFTKAELARLELSLLFPDLNTNDLSPTSDQNIKSITTKCRTHNNNEFEVIINLNYLDTQGTWLLATLEPVVIHQLQQSEQQRLSQRLEDLYILAHACQEENFDQGLTIALKSGHNLTGASHLAVYILESKDRHLVRKFSWGETHILPDHIPPTDVSALITPTLWIPGKRSTATIHRAARAANLSYLATAPLGESSTFVGLLVAADANTTPAPDLTSILKIIAANITTIIQHYTLTSHLLEDKKEQLQTITIGDTIKDHIQENVILLGNDLKIIDMNPSTEWTLGYVCREVCGEPIENVLIGAENLIPALQTAQRGVPTHNLGNVRLHRRNGETFLAHVQILPVTADDHPERIIILIRDLSEHEQFRVRNQQLEQRALLGEVTAIFAHEVRNQINSVSTGLQLMAINLPEDNPNQKLITRLGGELNRINHLMNSALAFSRPAQNTMVPVELSALIHRLIERWRPRLVREGVQHHIQVSTDHPIVMGDARTLEQVFTNLISNAVDAMSERGGTLTVHIRSVKDSADRDQVEVSVSDNGPGIPEEDHDRIFDPFFSTSRSGTGLGLAIAKRIVTAHKGTISVTSIPGGTVFQVVLPASKNSPS